LFIWIMMITPADLNEKLFKEIVDGFPYAAAGQRSISNPEQAGGSSQKAGWRSATEYQDAFAAAEGARGNPGKRT
jgi:hypothetical protein